MKILRTIGILALVAGLVLGGTGSAFAKGPPEEPPGGGSHSPGKRGLFGTVTSVTPINGSYVIELETEEGIFDITADDTTTKYMVPGETKGPKDLDRFLEIVDENDDGDLEELVDRKLAVLVKDIAEYGTPPPDFTATAIRLMLIPSPSSPPSHAHRVGIVDTFTEGTSITIIDKDGESHTFTINEDTVYRPEGTTAGDISTADPWSFVTVVTKGDPKLGTAIAKAIVLHEDLPDWAPEP